MSSWAGCPSLTVMDCQPGWGPFSTGTAFFFRCASQPFIPSFLVFSPSSSSSGSILETTLVLPSLQRSHAPTNIYTEGTSPYNTLHPRPPTYWACPATFSIDSHNDLVQSRLSPCIHPLTHTRAHTKILTLNGKPCFEPSLDH